MFGRIQVCSCVCRSDCSFAVLKEVKLDFYGAVVYKIFTLKCLQVKRRA